MLHPRASGADLAAMSAAMLTRKRLKHLESDYTKQVHARLLFAQSVLDMQR